MFFRVLHLDLLKLTCKPGNCKLAYSQLIQRLARNTQRDRLATRCLAVRQTFNFLAHNLQLFGSLCSNTNSNGFMKLFNSSLSMQRTPRSPKHSLIFFKGFAFVVASGCRSFTCKSCKLLVSKEYMNSISMSWFLKQTVLIHHLGQKTSYSLLSSIVIRRIYCENFKCFY